MHTTQTYHFLAIVSPEREVYVVKTTTPHFRKLYKSHRDGHHLVTAHLFQTGNPALFLLESAQVPAGKALARCILWSRRFHEAGYAVINWDNITPYVEHPHPDDPATYAAIQSFSLAALCMPERDLARNYSFKGSPTHTIKLSVSHEEWGALQLDATHKGLSLDRYLRERFYNGIVKTISLPELRSCEQQCRQVVTLLERETRLALLHGKCEVNINRLHTATHDLRLQVQLLTAALQRYTEELSL